MSNSNLTIFSHWVFLPNHHSRFHDLGFLNLLLNQLKMVSLCICQNNQSKVFVFFYFNTCFLLIYGIYVGRPRNATKQTFYLVFHKQYIISRFFLIPLLVGFFWMFQLTTFVAFKRGGSRVHFCVLCGFFS